MRVAANRRKSSVGAATAIPGEATSTLVLECALPEEFLEVSSAPITRVDGMELFTLSRCVAVAGGDTNGNSPDQPGHDLEAGNGGGDQQLDSEYYNHILLHSSSSVRSIKVAKPGSLHTDLTEYSGHIGTAVHSIPSLVFSCSHPQVVGLVLRWSTLVEFGKQSS